MQDKNYHLFIHSKYRLVCCCNGHVRLADLLQFYDRLEYIYYLFGGFEYNKAACESEYLLDYLKRYRKKTVPGCFSQVKR